MDQRGDANPFEFRDLARAQMHYSDKTVDQVLAEQKTHRDSRRTTTAAGRKMKGAKLTPPPSAVPRQSEVDKLQAILAQASRSRDTPTD